MASQEGSDEDVMVVTTPAVLSSYTYTYTQIIQLASIRRASAWIDVPDFASGLTVTGGRVADLSATFVGYE